jgi:cobyrinic acid a,c-diamide synthase
MRLHSPRLTVAGLSGDSGKTLVSLGITRALVERGLVVRTAKKGPDYIDAAWLREASGAECVNLDTFLMSDEAIGSGVWALHGADLILIEGNRGLYDGVDAEGTHSTAELAKRLGSPVVLVVDTTKTTRTVAALVLGCREMDPELELAAVILNRVGTSRQEKVIRRAIETEVGVPVIGAIPRLAGDDPLPGRHLGLVTVAEHPDREHAIARAAAAVAENVDLDRVVSLARTAPTIEMPLLQREIETAHCRVGYFADEAFSFYYPENLECLRKHGAELVALAPREERRLPDIDGLYIGGGFPEVHAERLENLVDLGADLRRRVAQGLPVYAECGGLMYLARELVVDGAAHKMSGVLDLVVEQTARPQGHGYMVATVDRANPFFDEGVELKGHEFHYSRVIAGEDRDSTVLAVMRGSGIGGGRDGLVKNQVWASYLHLHALGSPGWADGFLRMAAHYAADSSGSTVTWEENHGQS